MAGALKKGMVLGSVGMAALAFWAWFRTQNGYIRIGHLGSLTGKASAIGRSCRDGALLAVEEINARGGAGGRRIELVVRDDAGEIDGALAALRDFAEQGIAVAVGPTQSQVAVAAVKDLERLGLLLVGPVIATSTLSGRDDLFVRPYATTFQIGRRLAEVVLEEGYRRVALVLEQGNADFSNSVARAFREAFPAGNEVVEVPFTSGGSEGESRSLARHVLRSEPDAVVFSAGPVDVAVMSQILRRERPNLGLFTTSWGMSQETLQAGGRAVEGLVAVMALRTQDSSERYRTFEERYRARFGEAPGFCAVFNYETLEMLAEVLTVRRLPTAAGIKESLLAHGAFQGLQREFSFDAFGDVKRDVFVHRVHGGELKVEE